MSRLKRFSVFFLWLIFFSHFLFANEISLLKKYFLSGHMLLQQGHFEEASKKLEKISHEATAIQDYVLFDYAQSLWSEKKCIEAKGVFSDLEANYPESRWADLARTISRSHEECPPLEIPEPVVEKYDCANASTLIASADCYFDSRQYTKAKEVYQKLVGPPHSRSKTGVQFLVRLSQSAARSQDFKTAIEANRLMMARYPKSPQAHEALRKIAFLYQDAGQYEDAIPALKQVLKKTKNNQERRDYWGKIAWSQYRLGHYREALDSYEEAIQQGETAQLLYWKARSLEKNKKNKTGEKPQEVYQNIIQMYPATYYAVRAAERLNRLGIGTDYKSWWTPVGLQWSEEEKEFSASSYLDKIYTLTSLDLIADAEVEIRLARQNNDDSQWEGLPLPNDPRRFVKKSDAYRFHFRIPTQDTEYRLPYADFLFSEIKRHQNFIDPFLVYAIMRQESRYRPSIVSPVGAIGLLQIMPYTGRKLSKEAGWSVFTPSWLRDPLTNIELSVFYLKKLDNLFAGKWYATVASYNAGEFAVSQWLKQRHGLSEEEFIEEIPYGETRDYVKKIYTNWKAYQTIY